jgi:hypothetical protein
MGLRRIVLGFALLFFVVPAHADTVPIAADSIFPSLFVGGVQQTEHFVASFDWNTVTEVASNVSFSATGPIAASLFSFQGTFFDAFPQDPFGTDTWRADWVTPQGDDFLVDFFPEGNTGTWGVGDNFICPSCVNSDPGGSGGTGGDPNPTPEPSVGAMLMFAAAGLLLFLKKKRQSVAANL